MKALLLFLLCTIHPLRSQAEERRRLSVLIVTLPLSGHLAVPVSLGEELARRGHRVSVFVATPKGYSRPKEQIERAGLNYLTSHTSFTVEEFIALQECLSNRTRDLLPVMISGEKKIITRLQELQQVTFSFLNKSEPNQWDLIVTDEETLPVTSCLGNKWKVPIIVLNSHLQFDPIHQPPWPFPSLLSNNLTDNLDIRGRFFVPIQALLSKLVIALIFFATSSPQDECPATISQIMSIPGVRVPQIVPTVIGFEYPRPISPLTTYTGPILSPVTDPLPDDIQVWLDGHSPRSVVYISMGSQAILHNHDARAIIEGLNTTGYSAVWSLRKKNRDILDGLEINDKKILLLEWAPQLAILRHRSIGMAILHGGMNGLHEALHSGVPVIVLPMFGDQPSNADRIAHHGLGIQLDPNDFSSSQVIKSVRDIEKGDYHTRVAKLQKMFHHAGGVTKAADLVEFYAEVGYDHLIPAYARFEWSWIQYYNMDVYALILLIGGLGLLFVFKLCRCLCAVCCCVKAKPKTD